MTTEKLEAPTIHELVKDPFLDELLEIFADFFDGFGFKPNLGRIWTVLFYSVEPLSRREIMQIVSLSSGMVSQGLNELTRFGMVVAVQLPGRRETLYRSERNLIKIVSSILGKREATIVERLMMRIDDLKQRLAVSPHNARLVNSRIEGLDQVLEIGALCMAMISLVETFSHYSYHAISLGARAINRLRIPRLPKMLRRQAR